MRSSMLAAAGFVLCTRLARPPRRLPVAWRSRSGASPTPRKRSPSISRRATRPSAAGRCSWSSTRGAGPARPQAVSGSRRPARLGHLELLQLAERRSARAQRKRRERDAGVGAGAPVARPGSFVPGGLLRHRAGRARVRRRACGARGGGDRRRRCAGVHPGRSGDGVRG